MSENIKSFSSRNVINKFDTFALLKKRSSITKMGSAFNFFGISYFSYNVSDSAKDADTKAIFNDWGVVGDDIRQAISLSGSK